MRLAQVKRHWNEFGKRDPFWAILTEPDKRNGKWNPDEFFQTGRQDIAKVLARLESLGIACKRERALDFGCGAGRLTRAMAAQFKAVFGVDIAPSMIELARKHNPPANCHFVLNQQGDLGLFADESFDFIYSVIVLQHLDPRDSLGYIREFLRVLAPSGVLVFQLPCAQFQALQDGQKIAGFAIAEPLDDCRAGTDMAVNAIVRNLGSTAWPGEQDRGVAQTRILYSWSPRREPGAYSLATGATLPPALRPQEEVPLSLRIRIPRKPGKYTLKLGLEGWLDAGFGPRGISVVVESSGLVRARVGFAQLLDRLFRLGFSHGSKLIGRPVMEMHGVDRPSVVKNIRNSGGTVIQVERDYCAGPRWLSYTYYVSK